MTLVKHELRQDKNSFFDMDSFYWISSGDLAFFCFLK